MSLVQYYQIPTIDHAQSGMQGYSRLDSKQFSRDKHLTSNYKLFGNPEIRYKYCRVVYFKEKTQLIPKCQKIIQIMEEVGVGKDLVAFHLNFQLTNQAI